MVVVVWTMAGMSTYFKQLNMSHKPFQAWITYSERRKKVEHVAHSLKQVWRHVLSIKEGEKLNTSSTAHLGCVGRVQREEKAEHVQHSPL
jgi:hypothetical protein